MRTRTSAIYVALLMALLMVGCKAKEQKPGLEIVPNDDNTISITANKAGIGGGGGADITVSAGQKLVIDAALSKGEIQIRFFREEAPANPDATVEEILHTNDVPSLDVAVDTAGTTEHAVDPGHYTIMVNVLKTTTGTITVSAK